MKATEPLRVQSSAKSPAVASTGSVKVIETFVSVGTSVSPSAGFELSTAGPELPPAGVGGPAEKSTAFSSVSVPVWLRATEVVLLAAGAGPAPSK